MLFPLEEEDWPYQLKKEFCFICLQGDLGIYRRGSKVRVILGTQNRGSRELLNELLAGVSDTIPLGKQHTFQLR